MNRIAVVVIWVPIAAIIFLHSFLLGRRVVANDVGLLA